MERNNQEPRSGKEKSNATAAAAAAAEAEDEEEKAEDAANDAAEVAIGRRQRRRNEEDNEEASPAYITDVDPDDILMGRGAPMSAYQGNVKFRALVATRQDEYANVKFRRSKDRIAREILDVLDNRKVRFLNRVESEKEAKRLSVPEGVSAWYEADEDAILEKIKQALRHREHDNTSRPRQRQRSRDGGSRRSKNRETNEGPSSNEAESAAGPRAVMGPSAVAVANSDGTVGHPADPQFLVTLQTMLQQQQQQNLPPPPVNFPYASFMHQSSMPLQPATTPLQQFQLQHLLAQQQLQLQQTRAQQLDMVRQQQQRELQQLQQQHDLQRQQILLNATAAAGQALSYEAYRAPMQTAATTNAAALAALSPNHNHVGYYPFVHLQHFVPMAPFPPAASVIPAQRGDASNNGQLMQLSKTLFPTAMW